ncbi:zinc finger MYM-type protein 1-like [Rhopalosiphum maidis]|uniref:zinc finger MYM-type protein 1-like n=1 Tax=Rhopalosiphum maidis TaxID=43146 RepID=UPI000F003F80|nr:zinc finger MYM-type protein 1-like [Rhopalosiphum maidis]
MLLGANRIEHALSEGRRLAAIKHNENVGVNRRILTRLIHVICFLGKQEIAFRGHNEDSSSINKGNYLELLDLLSREEQLLREHFMSNSVFKGTSSDIQNDLISCITSVLKTKISNELQKANFISIRADKTTDVSCKSQMSIIFRYVVDNKIEERFIGFFDVSKDKSAFGLSEILLTEIKNWNIGDKLVCQTYDGAAVMAGQKNGVQDIIKQSYPKAMFIHCYAHQLNLVFLHGSKSIKSVKIFISDLTMFHTFFSRSPKKSQLLREKGFKLPQSCETKWNYHSRAAATITTHFIELKKAITCVTDEDDWDPITINMAYDHVFLILQTKCTADVQYCVNQIKIFSDQLIAMRKEETISICYNLLDVYQELSKLLQLVLCIPVTTSSSERNMSALKRIKTFLRNSMNNDRLSNLSSLAIEKQMLNELSTDPTFIDEISKQQNTLLYAVNTSYLITINSALQHLLKDNAYPRIFNGFPKYLQDRMLQNNAKETGCHYFNEMEEFALAVIGYCQNRVFGLNN